MAMVFLDDAFLPADKAQLPALSPAARWGIGCFETMRMSHGKIPLLPYHLDRTLRGLHELNLSAQSSLSSPFLESIFLELSDRNQIKNQGRARLSILATSETKASILCELSEFTEDANSSRIATCPDFTPARHPLSHLKLLSYLPYRLAAQWAQAHEWDDVLLVSSQGEVIESARSNVFIHIGNRWFTPPLSQGCVAGIARQLILEKLPGAHESLIRESQLREAEEVFLCNALRGIQPVRELNNRTYSTIRGQQLHDELFTTIFR